MAGPSRRAQRRADNETKRVEVLQWLRRLYRRGIPRYAARPNLEFSYRVPGNRCDFFTIRSLKLFEVAMHIRSMKRRDNAKDSYREWDRTKRRNPLYCGDRRLTMQERRAPTIADGLLDFLNS